MHNFQGLARLLQRRLQRGVRHCSRTWRARTLVHKDRRQMCGNIPELDGPAESQNFVATARTLRRCQQQKCGTAGNYYTRYHIAEQIGAGGMGVVYRARDQRLDRDVALKVLPPGSLTDQASRSRFRKEALALSRLTHPNIAVVHDFDTLDDTDFLVMELVPGITLEE